MTSPRFPRRARLSTTLGSLFALLEAASTPAQLTSVRSVRFTEETTFFTGPGIDDHFGQSVAAGDFDGDNVDDLAIGIPEDDNLSALHPRSGIVVVRYGRRGSGPDAGETAQVLSQAFGGSPDPPGDFDLFGWSIAAGDFDGDGFDDLAVGALFDDPDGAGAVSVYRGTAEGLSLTSVAAFHQDSAGVPGEAESGDVFGWSVAAGDFDADGFDDLAVGVPRESSDFDVVHGRVVVLHGSASGLTSEAAQSFDQDAPAAMDGSNEDADGFGTSLATGDFDGDGYEDLAVGVPGENGSAGGVHLLLGGPDGLSTAGNELWTQNDPGVPGAEQDGARFADSLVAGDFDGDGFDDLAAGVPFLDLDFGGGDVRSDAGTVIVLPGSAAGLDVAAGWVLNASSAGAGASEAEDFWGAALAAGDFDRDGRADLAVGVPGESSGSLAGVGEIAVLRGALPTARVWAQESPGVPDFAEAGDGFGGALVAGDFDGNGQDDLAIGGPGESTVASRDGAVWLLFGSLFADGLEGGSVANWSGVVP